MDHVLTCVKVSGQLWMVNKSVTLRPNIRSATADKEMLDSDTLIIRDGCSRNIVYNIGKAVSIYGRLT